MKTYLVTYAVVVETDKKELDEIEDIAWGIMEQGYIKPTIENIPNED